jgi:hypothetical protein
MPQRPASQNSSIFLWHPELHRRVAAEQLIFVLAAFEPFYRRDRMVEEIKGALRTLSIGSYAMWELIGDHDLMIQAWLPHHARFGELKEEISSRVTGGVSIDMLTMAVDKVIHHWMWDLDNDINGAAKDIQSSDYVYLNSAAPAIPQRRVQKYVRLGYVHQTPRSDDVKFFLRISNPGPRHATSDELEGKLTEIAKKVLTNGRVRHGVLMKVSGDGGSYLLTGRVRPEHYPAITEVVGGGFRSAGLLESVRRRTVTHLSALPVPVDRREQLLPTPKDDPTQKPTADDIRACMLRDESDDLEFKASAFTDVAHLLGFHEHARPRDEQLRDVAKAVTGMLNADGGMIVIGVAEAGKLDEEQLANKYGESERHSERIAIGVNREFPAAGWDGYQLQLATKLRQMIGKDVDSWIKYHGVLVGSKTVGVIRVNRPSDWFYLRVKDKTGQVIETFYGRAGGETLPLTGRAADAFKAAHPRTTSGAR